MPEQPGKRFGLPGWLALLVLLALLTFLGGRYRQELSAFVDRSANAASFLGLLVGVFGCALTI